MEKENEISKNSELMANDTFLSSAPNEWDCDDCKHNEHKNNGCGLGMKELSYCGDHSKRSTP